MMAALSVVLRRDMSLNRRLFLWLEVDQDILEPLTRQLMVQALKSLLASRDVKEVSKPYLILISLLDRSFGNAIVGDLFVDIIQATMDKQESSTPEYTKALSNDLQLLNKGDDPKISGNTTADLIMEVNKASGMLFDALDPFFIWKRLQLFLKEHELTEQHCQLIIFILDHFHLSDDETVKIHLPLFYYALAEKILHLSQRGWDHLLLCQKLLVKIEKTTFVSILSLKDFRAARQSELLQSPVSGLPQSPSLGMSRESSHAGLDLDISLEVIYKMYECLESPEKIESSRFLSRIKMGEPVLTATLEYMCRLLDQLNQSLFENGGNEGLLNLWKMTREIIQIHLQANPHEFHHVFQFLGSLKGVLLDTKTDFDWFYQGVSLLFQLHETDLEHSDLFDKSLICCIFEKCWLYFCDQSLERHEQIFELFMLMGQVAPSSVGSEILALMINKNLDRAQNQHKFARLWNFYVASKIEPGQILVKPLLFGLGCLLSNDRELSGEWESLLSLNFYNFESIVRPILRIMMHHLAFVHERRSSDQIGYDVLIYRGSNLSQVDFCVSVLSKLGNFKTSMLVQTLIESTAQSLATEHSLDWVHDKSLFATMNMGECLFLLCLG